jgi:diaminopimelate epimerase
MKKIAFSKYHGLGNDFIIIDRIKKRKGVDRFDKLARDICQRNFGVGADGILVLTGSKGADCRMDIYNSDGSWAEKSGNGLRIAAAYYFAAHLKNRKLRIESGDGISDAEIIRVGKQRSLIKVSLGKPLFETRLVPVKSRFKFHINRPLKIGNLSLNATVLSVGNPHTVIFVDNFDFDWKELGRNIENAPPFPRRTNVEFAMIVGHSKLILNDWERGAGATGSSGTGAAAAVVAGVVNGYLKREVEVIFPAGSLFIDWSERDDIIYLTGPVEYICRGDYHFGAK